MGFFLDIYIEYLVRVVVRFIHAWRVRAWQTERAKIISASHRPAGFGCAVADLAYEYSFGGELYTGTNANPFVMTSSAKGYIEHYFEGGEVIVRVNPQNRESSFMLEQDQLFLPNGETLKS